MKTKLLAAAALAALVATPATAQEQRKQNARDILGRVLEAVLTPAEQRAQEAEAQAEAEAEANATVAPPTLEQVLADARRDDDRARDRYRNPMQTLQFFQVEPTHTVVEYAPGGGWYTRVLAPYIMPRGQYIAVNGDSDARTYPDAEAEQRAKAWGSNFKTTLGESMGIAPEAVTAFEIDEVPEEVKGTVDRILVIRSMHGLWNSDEADSVLGSLREMLADDGMVGVVQHRAPAGASWSDVNPAQGYMRQSDVIKLYELHGFELVGTSEINANPRDPANWGGGVWTLPPVLRYGDRNRARYEAVGESDRMTLLFRKAP
ncbi:class I SAM-dependent methyltransferase [Erythrobacter litoralis]|uniref:Methyltransferase n=1 Tax=Erythrobacter litoralis (strain HTCC2594) TaxID=314225 RepID=Q2N7J2_ERYLH|nr:class I SAM-dependent methyltransferase [Erythrobacter litoralis]ABC64349.1 hypothetical protein ELI_11285 [Erythrobacter litoralis HTCC2594]